jgi:hypothetical protein
MKTYTAILAEDVPHYANVEIHAASDSDAIEAAKAYDRDELYFEPEWENTVCSRIVEITDDATGRSVALDLALDDYFLRNGGKAERALCEAAPELLAVLEAAGRFSWVCNAALTTDIEALRKICLEYADWWNGQAWPAIEKAKAGAS